MLQIKPLNRMSARQALKHSWLKGSRSYSAADIVANTVESSVAGAMDALSSAVPISRGNSLSEAELYSALNKEEEDDMPPPVNRNTPRTVAWWQQRAVWSSTLCSKIVVTFLNVACHTTPHAETTRI